MKRFLRVALRALGFDIVRYRPPLDAADLPRDASAEDKTILDRIRGYTMTSVDRQLALLHAVRHVVRTGVQGSFVECGVWRGGSAMAAALAFIQEGETKRDLYLFDTFEGMTAPTDVDRSVYGVSAQAYLDQVHANRDIDRDFVWCIAGLEDVQANMLTVNYPTDRIFFVRGPVESTISTETATGPIAVLRLDTDWYESTRHELVHLFPLISPGGILIVDDYGHWAGARKALDEYLEGLPQRYYLHRIDYTGRLLVKL